MKLKIPVALALLCTLVLPVAAAPAQEGAAGLLAPPATELYPYEIRISGEGELPHLEKVYILTTQDDPRKIPTASFVQDNLEFTFLDMTKQDFSDIDTKEHTETVTLESSTSNMEKILQQLQPQLEYESEDGYIGTLALNQATIQVEAAGYKSSSRTVTATRVYPNLSDADVSLLPKTVEENGRTLTLADVSWETAAGTQTDGYQLALRHNATVTYTGTATSKNATGYLVTAQYMGEITKTSLDKVVYTAVFSGSAAQPEPTQKVSLGDFTDWLVVFLLFVLMGLAFMVCVSIILKNNAIRKLEEKKRKEIESK